MDSICFRIISFSLLIVLCTSIILTSEGFLEPYSSNQLEESDIAIQPGIILEYMIMVTVREENSSIAIPIPANMTIQYQDFLDNSTINSTMTVSSFILTLYYNGSETGVIWENISSREVKNIILEQANLLNVFYQVYNNESVTNYTPFWIFKKNWTLGEKIGAFSYELEISNITNVYSDYIGQRTVIFASVSRYQEKIRDDALMVYDFNTGLLIQGEIISWNSLYFNPPVVYTTRLELVRSNYDFSAPRDQSTAVTTTDLIITPIFITITRGTTLYMIFAVLIPVAITAINFSRIKKIRGGIE